jgi:hypothetical protein
MIKRIIVIFDSEKQTMDQVKEPAIVSYNEDYDLDTMDISDKKSTIRKKALSLLYQHGTTNTPLYLFQNSGDTYNSHYFEHGPINKDVTLRKLKNE